MQSQRGSVPSHIMKESANKVLDEHFRGLLEENESVSAWMCRVASMLGGDTRDGLQLMYVLLTTGMIIEILLTLPNTV